MNRRTFVPVLVAAAALFGALDAAAQEQDLISMELGARFFMGDANGRLRKGPGPSHVSIDDDFDAAGDTTGSAISVSGRLKGGHSFNIQGWQYNSDGSATQSETQAFGSLLLVQGSNVAADVEMRYVSTKFVFGLTPEREPYRIGLGISGKVLDWNTQVKLDTGESESLRLRTIYPSVELEASYRVGEAIELRAEGALGMPAYAKKGIEVQNPIEARAGVRITLGGVTIEGGFQVFDALLVQDEDRPEEISANVNLSGIYFELAARF
jgi:hypothetical protein